MPKNPERPPHISPEDWEAVDSPALTDAQLASMRPANEVLPEAFLKAVREGRVGRPKSEIRKRPVSIRISEELWNEIKSSGKGYHTRVEAALRDAVTQGRI